MIEGLLNQAKVFSTRLSNKWRPGETTNLLEEGRALEKFPVEYMTDLLTFLVTDIPLLRELHEDCSKTASS